MVNGAWDFSAKRWACAAWVVGFCGPAVLPERTRGDAFTGYQLVDRFQLPPGAVAFDALADGRVIAISGAQVYIETAPASESFTLAGSLPDADLPSIGAAFLKVSPDGTRFAVGNNGGTSFANYRVGVFTLSSFSGVWFAAAHFDAAWLDDSHLALTAGDFVDPSYVTILDTASPDPNNPVNSTVIDGIGGASAGVAFDSAGNLYTGNGFSLFGPSGTGLVKAFLQSDWTPALSGGPALDFEVEGIVIADILSASPIGFDAEGNLLVAGGDSSEPDQTDFIAVVRASAVADALAGSGPADPNDPNQVRRLDPDPANPSNFYTVSCNLALGRIYAKDFGSTLVHAYEDVAGVPTLSSWGVMAMVLLVAITGTLALRQRPPASRSSPGEMA